MNVLNLRETKLRDQFMMLNFLRLELVKVLFHLALSFLYANSEHKIGCYDNFSAWWREWISFPPILSVFLTFYLGKSCIATAGKWSFTQGSHALPLSNLLLREVMRCLWCQMFYYTAWTSCFLNFRWTDVCSALCMYWRVHKSQGQRWFFSLE